jgi:hypothetical protein
MYLIIKFNLLNFPPRITPLASINNIINQIYLKYTKNKKIIFRIYDSF